MEILKTGSIGPLVELLQSILKKLGWLSGNIDGIFGEQTKNAVIAFQRNSGLWPDGIVGSGTWLTLSPYINGYDIHTISTGDTLFFIARRYSTTVDRILTANPGIDVYNLRIGQKIVVPFGSVVPTDISYSHDIMSMNIQSLKMIYPFLETGTIGNSELCKDLQYIRIGKGSKEVFYNASFHANEWITTPVLMKFIENFSKAYADNADIYGYNARSLFSDVSIYIVPMVNPDGVDLVTGAIKPETPAYNQAKDIALNFPWLSFPDGWKANISGIDLNLQFPANWEQAREIKFAQGYNKPAPRDYVGPAPLFASESLAVYEFTLAHNFRLSLSYHTQGRVIFWQYLDYLPPYSYEIAQELSQSSGYTLEETPYASSFAGYKDWFIQDFNLPGYTIEAGTGINPLPISQFDTIYNENEGMLILGAILAR